jgi:hypothetical protein
VTTIFGLPAHALLVHAIVVLAPLVAALEILCALWPAARRRLVWLVLALAAGVVVLTPLTTAAGEWLYDQSPQHPPILEAHAESRSAEPKRVLAAVAAVLAVVVGVSTIVGVVRIGDAGAQAVWGVRQ